MFHLNTRPMSNDKHTPTPWEVGASKRSVIKADGQNSKVIAAMRTSDSIINGSFADGEPEANAARIVQCVNACEGLDDPEKWIKHQKEYRNEMSNSTLSQEVDKRLMLESELATLRAEKAELIEALRGIIKNWDDSYFKTAEFTAPIINQARQTIAKIETK